MDLSFIGGGFHGKVCAAYTGWSNDVLHLYSVNMQGDYGVSSGDG